MLFVCLFIYSNNVCEFGYCLNSGDVVGNTELLCGIIAMHMGEWGLF